MPVWRAAQATAGASVVESLHVCERQSAPRVAHRSTPASAILIRRKLGAGRYQSRRLKVTMATCTAKSEATPSPSCSVPHESGVLTWGGHPHAHALP